MDKLNEKNIEGLIKDILLHGGFVFESITIEDDGIGIIRFNISSKGDSKLLIGPHGEHLQALNMLVKRIIEFAVSDENLRTYQYIIDVNDYQKSHIEHLRNQTKIIAERVKVFKKEMPMPAMSAFDRMIIHGVAQTIEGITTRSEGIGRDRYVVIGAK